jgi:hypothetical protein
MLMARGDMQRPLKESGRGGDGSGARRRARSTLSWPRSALAVMLLVGAALLARSFQRLVEQDPGFKPAHAVTARVELPYSYSDWSKIADFYDRLLIALRAEPGVAIAGASNFLPLEAAWRGPFFVEGRPRPRSGDEAQAQHPDRGRRLLPRAGRAARQGPLLRSARHRGGARGDRHQRRARAAASGRARIRSGSR